MPAEGAIIGIATQSHGFMLNITCVWLCNQSSIYYSESRKTMPNFHFVNDKKC